MTQLFLSDMDVTTVNTVRFSDMKSSSKSVFFYLLRVVICMDGNQLNIELKRELYMMSISHNRLNGSKRVKWCGTVFFLFVASMIFQGCLQEPSVWVAPSTARIMEMDPPRDHQTAELFAAKNEYEAFQVVINGGLWGLENVDIQASDLIGPQNNIIEENHITLFKEEYVKIDTPSFLLGVLGNSRSPGNYPDPLIPFYDPYTPDGGPVGVPFNVNKHVNQPIWIDIKIPDNIPAGLYKGELSISADDIEPVQIEIELNVWDFALPDKKNISTAFGFGWDKIRWYHGGMDGQYDEESLKIIKNYEKALHQHRIDQTKLTNRVSKPFKFDEEGNLLPVDWTQYDNTIGPYLTGEYFGDGFTVNRFNAGFFSPGSGSMKEGLTDDQYKQAAAEFARHLKEKGWMDRVYIYVLDEPFINPGSYQWIADDIALMLEADPDWQGHFLVTNWYDERLDGYVDIWCPNTPYYDDWFLGVLGTEYYGRNDYPGRFLKGEELWFYVCIGTVPPYAGYDIDTRIGYEPRILLWGTWFEGATGFLYWNTNHWVKENPWEVLIDQDTFGNIARTGDGFLFYPGDHDGTAAPAGSPSTLSIDGPITSIRLKQTREGLEDWELFMMASQIAGEEKVREIVSQAYRQFGVTPFPFIYHPFDPPWTYDENTIHQVRKEVAELIIDSI